MSKTPRKRITRKKSVISKRIPSLNGGVKMESINNSKLENL